MEPNTDALPFAYHRCKRISFTRSDRFGSSYFGGPGRFLIEACSDGPNHIHHIATIRNIDFGVLGYDFGFVIPFFYPMRADGCELSYQRTAQMAIAVTSMSPEEPEGVEPPWPYDDYPRLLPYVPLKVHEAVEMPLDTFSDEVMQGVQDVTEEELIFVVPPNPLLGCSLWGPTGDAEGYQIIFRYNTVTGTMTVGTACT